MVAILFKYAAVPLLLPGFIAALWQLWLERNSGPRKKLWFFTLVSQVACVGLTAAWLFFVYGATGLIGKQQEANQFVNHGLAKLLDFSFVAELFKRAAYQIGLIWWSCLAILLGGLALQVLSSKRAAGQQDSWRFPLSEDSRTKIVGWVIVALTTFSTLWFTVTYEVAIVDQSSDYYIISGVLGVLILAAIGLAAAVEFLASIVRLRVVRFAAVIVILVMWLTPLSTEAVSRAQQRTLPDTRAKLVNWAVSAIPNGSIIVAGDSADAFNKEWGGYRGPYRVWLVSRLLDRPRTDWIKDHVLYAQLDTEQLPKLLATDVGRNYLAQLLPLKQIPPDSQRAFWHGPSMIIYRLWRMQHELDANFGDQIKLLGYDLDPAAPKAGDTLTVTLYWQAVKKPTDNDNVYVHVYPMDSRTVIAQTDGAPLSYPYPTSAWDDPTETLISRPFQLTLPANLPNGQYRLATGFYDYQTGQRLPVGDTDFVQLTIITIPPVSPGKPSSSPQQFDF